jgi:nicotinamide riboside kinase
MLDRLLFCYFFCRLTLLLGPPSSGKTTLLLALAGRLGPGLQVYYNFLIALNNPNAIPICIDA